MKAKKLNSLLSAAALMGGLCLAGPAFALPCDGTNAASPGSCQEVDPAGLNNTIVGANFLGILNSLTTPLQVTGAIADTTTNPTDVDIFKFTIVGSETVSLTLFEDEGTFAAILSLLDTDANGNVVLDSDGPSTNPTVPGFSLVGPGTYYAKVEGLLIPADPENDVAASHDQGNYRLQINCDPCDIPNPNPVPEPASLLLLGSGLAGLALWRRKQA